ncbi:hypothetical protein D6825_03920 [Candidatus Woesearchaeota archaeon]|nr:MAG: hypothetical protein D6825_03920 [Candidatus Woesearchaeota archaeon]
MKKMALIAVLMLLAACNGAISPSGERGNIPQIDISPPKPLPEPPRYEPPPTAPEEYYQAEDIEVKAYDSTIIPSQIRVAKGDVVELTITTVESRTRFTLEDYGIDVELIPGKAVEITFTADAPGKFNYKTSTGARGELIVE